MHKADLEADRSLCGTFIYRILYDKDEKNITQEKDTWVELRVKELMGAEHLKLIWRT